ncbi:MAG: type I secretion protein TolC [Alphaproteobacteria bacterium]|nr:MAG: type I secretion protein TolC [Alphaproteobacteria bacterium]
MRIFAALVLMASVSTPALAQASRDTLADAVDSAVSNNPTLMAERKARGVADETLNQAKAQMGPQVNLTASYGTQETGIGRQVTTATGSFPEDGTSQRGQVGLEARQSLWSGGSLSAQRDQAMAGVNAAQARLINVEQQTVLSVVSAFVDVRRGERELEIRETNVASLRKQVEAATDRFEVGEVTRTDVSQAQAQQAASEAELAKSKSDLARARAIYEQIVGRPPVQLAEPPLAPALPGSLDEAIGVAMNGNPVLLTARALEQQGERSVDIARGALAPKFDLVGNAGLTDTRYDQSYQDTNVGLFAEFRFPLFNGGLLESKTRGAQLDADKARYQRLATEREVTQQTTTAWHKVIAAREAITASTSRVAAAEVALEGAMQELAVGTRITLDVLDQERELLNARLGKVDAERQAYLAIHELLAAMGRLRPESISK